MKKLCFGFVDLEKAFDKGSESSDEMGSA